MPRTTRSLRAAQLASLEDFELPRFDKPAVVIFPRGYREADAGNYLGFSGAYLRALRIEDTARIERGEPPVGPAWVKIGRAVRYLREDLDWWLDQRRVAASAKGEACSYA